MADETKKTNIPTQLTPQERERIAYRKLVEKEKERLALLKQKEREKTRLALQKQREKEKLALQKQREREKAKLALQKQREREKAKLALQKQKEKERLALQKQKEALRTKAGETKLQEKKPSVKAGEIKKQVEKETEQRKQNEETETTQKEAQSVKKETKAVSTSSDKEKFFDELEKKETLSHSEEKPLDHVAILRKKMEAQKKLKEDIPAPAERSPAPDIRSKPEEAYGENIVEPEEEHETSDKIRELEEKLALLAHEIKEKENLIGKQDAELKDQTDRIAILTNSIVTKTNEEELAKELASLKRENTKLKEELEASQKALPKDVAKEKEPVIDINSAEVREIIAQGDILLRIKLLNQRIAEKDAKIKLVEEELDRLSEKDIVALNFIKQIKRLRESRRETVANANIHLKELNAHIKREEGKLEEHIKSHEAQKAKIKAFDREWKAKKLTYTEKEMYMSDRLRLIAEEDGLKQKIDEIEANFKKLVNHYKKILRNAETHVEESNQYENELIALYLKKLRDAKTSENKDYNENLAERENLLKELDKLNRIYEEIKAGNSEEMTEINPEELNAMKKELARITGKLNRIAVRYAERIQVEEVLRTIDPDVSKYLAAFSEKEKLIYDIDKDTARLNSENKDHLAIVINDNRSKIELLDKTINAYEAHEKVVFYKQLLKSIAEIEEKETIFKNKAAALKEKIITAEKEEP